MMSPKSEICFNFELVDPARQGETCGVAATALRHSAATASAVELLMVDARVRRFPQERARRTYEALLVAAEQAFTADGYDATGTPDIAARAKVSVGTFYRYFDDKKQAFIEVSRRHLANGYHRILEQLTPDRFEGRARHATITMAIDVLVDHVARYPRMHGVFMEMSLRDPEVQALRRAFDEVSRAKLAELIAAAAPRAAVPDAAATAWVIHIAAVECASALAGLHGPPGVAVDRAKAALGAVIERALFGE